MTVSAGCGGNAFQSGGGSADAGGEAGRDGGITQVGITDGGMTDGGSWCSSQTALFCEDFDEYGAIGDLYASSKWSKHSETSGSFRLTSSSSPPSPPNSLEVIGGDGASVLLDKTFAPLASSPKHARLEFDLRVDMPGSPDLLVASGFAAIGFGAGIDDGYVALVIAHGPQLAMAWGIGGDAGLPGDAGTLGLTHVMTFPVAGRWMDRFAIDIDYTLSCVQVYDDKVAQLASCVQLPPELLARRTLSIVLGNYVVGLGTVGQTDLEFDDVTFNAQ